MVRMRTFPVRIPAALLAALLAGCAAQPLAPAPVSDNAAVLALVEQARAEVTDNRLANAAATVERALRLEPRNPRLWQELARVRLAQGEPAQAEALAARSNTWAGNDQTLRAANWRLIGESRTVRGDTAGAHEAEERARQLEH